MSATTQVVEVPGYVVPKIKPEYEKLVPPIPEIEYRALRDSIREHGQYELIKLNKHGIVLDGHQRLRACKDLGKQPHYEFLDFKNEAEEAAYVVEANLRRRQLSDYQKIELSKQLLEYERKAASIRQASKLVQNKTDPEFEHDPPLAPYGAKLENYEAKGKAAERVAQRIDVAPRTYQKGLAVMERAPEVIKAQARAGKLKIESAYKQTKALELASPEEKPRIIEKLEKGEARDVWDARSQVRRESSSNYKLIKNNAVEIECGDFTKLYQGVEANSVALILTDLPYSAKYMGLWEELGKAAERVLKPGAYLIAYTGGMFLPDVMNALGKHLRWYWPDVIKHTSNQTQIFPRKVRNRCKLALIYTKGDKPRDHDWFFDLQEGEKGDKDAHEWAQGESEAAYLISKFSSPGETIMDPCCGVGTFLRPAKELGRKVVGFEIDKERFERARESLAPLKDFDTPGAKKNEGEQEGDAAAVAVYCKCNHPLKKHSAFRSANKNCKVKDCKCKGFRSTGAGRGRLQQC